MRRVPALPQAEGTGLPDGSVLFDAQYIQGVWSQSQLERQQRTAASSREDVVPLIHVS